MNWLNTTTWLPSTSEMDSMRSIRASVLLDPSGQSSWTSDIDRAARRSLVSSAKNSTGTSSSFPFFFFFRSPVFTRDSTHWRMAS